MQNSLIVGLDEVGRGPLAGPVVAAAVVLPDTFDLPGLTDSKKLSAKKREALLPLICEQALSYATGWVSPQEIDEINILQASFVAMRRALAGIRVECRLALVDGNKDPGLNMPTRCIVGGDATEPAISAASIIAKQHRDRFMDDLAVQYPHYGFEKHAGYPTKAHMAAIQQVGICPQHRRSFGPVKRYLEEHHV